MWCKLNQRSDSISLTADDYTNSLISTCSHILYAVAPVKGKSPRTHSQIWSNDTKCVLPQACRQAERRWKKDRLQFSLDILRMSPLEFQNAAKMAKAAFLLDIIVATHIPRMLFKIFNSLVNPCPEVLWASSPALCIEFLNYFTDKIRSLKAIHYLVRSSAPILGYVHTNTVSNESASFSLRFGLPPTPRQRFAKGET